MNDSIQLLDSSKLESLFRKRTPVEAPIGANHPRPEVFYDLVEHPPSGLHQLASDLIRIEDRDA
jgi:hypothetical protein